MKDKYVSHSITNYLLASYQGKYTFINILNMLKFPGVDPGEIGPIKQALSKVSLWTSRLWQGQDLVAASWTEPKTIDAKEALQLLEMLKPDLAQLVFRTKVILNNPKFFIEPNDVKLLIAAFGRFAYSRENYLKGLIEFAKTFNLPAMITDYSALLPVAEEDVRAANSFVESFRVPEKLTPTFYRLLRARAFTLPGIFNTYLHDINQLLGPFKGGFSYDNADFTREEIKIWLDAGFEPAPAGYWRAYEFSPAESISWMRANVSDPGMAFDWRLNGFDTLAALPWMNKNFPPHVARSWVEVGYDPGRALEAIERGITDPQSAPKLSAD